MLVTTMILGIGGILFMWITYRYQLKDCSNLKVDAEVCRASRSPHEWCLKITLRNTGRRPCSITTIAFKLQVERVEINNIPLNVTEVTQNLCGPYNGQNSTELKEAEVKVIMVSIDKFHPSALYDKTGEGTIFVTDSNKKRISCKFRCLQHSAR